MVEPRSQGTGGKDPDRTAQAAPVAPVDAGAAAVAKKTGAAPMPGTADQAEEWRDRALRMQADMDNYRKRQRRIAQEQAQANQERLLRDILRVADNLDRALSPGDGQRSGRAGDSNGLRQGVELTRDELLRIEDELDGPPADPQ